MPCGTVTTLIERELKSEFNQNAQKNEYEFNQSANNDVVMTDPLVALLHRNRHQPATHAYDTATAFGNDFHSTQDDVQHWTLPLRSSLNSCGIRCAQRVDAPLNLAT
jgi:hypothetical protein